MGTNAATICAKVIDNTFEVLTVQSLAVTQAIEFLQIQDKLSSKGKAFYDSIRKIVPVFKEDEMSVDQFSLFKDVVDNGDFVEVTGILFVTQKGQQSIMVREWRMLSKSLLPLPERTRGARAPAPRAGTRRRRRRARARSPCSSRARPRERDCREGT